MPFGWPHAAPLYLPGNGHGFMCDPGGGFGTDKLVVSPGAEA